MDDWSIRRALPEDEAALTACLMRAYAPFASLSDLPPVTEGVADDIANHYVWVVEQGETLIGGAVLAIAPGRARLVNIAVDPDAAGRGLGRALMARVEDEARAWGVAAVQLTTHAEMVRARAFYAAQGWRETGREGNRIYLEKPLPG